MMAGGAGNLQGRTLVDGCPATRFKYALTCVVAFLACCSAGSAIANCLVLPLSFATDWYAASHPDVGILKFFSAFFTLGVTVCVLAMLCAMTGLRGTCENGWVLKVPCSLWTKLMPMTDDASSLLPVVLFFFAGWVGVHRCAGCS